MILDLGNNEMNTWSIGDVHFIGNSDLSGDIEIVRFVSDNETQRVTMPGAWLAIFYEKSNGRHYQ